MALADTVSCRVMLHRVGRKEDATPILLGVTGRTKMAQKTFAYDKKPEAKISNNISQKRSKSVQHSFQQSFDQIMFLQRTIGNQAVQRLLKSGAIQAKLIQENTATKDSQKNIQDFSFSFTFGTHIPFEMEQHMKLLDRFEKYATDHNLDFKVGSKLRVLFERIYYSFLKSSNEHLGLPGRAKVGETYEYRINANVKLPEKGMIEVKLVHPELRPIRKRLPEEALDTEKHETSSKKITCNIEKCSRKTGRVPHLSIEGVATNANGGKVSLFIPETEGCDESAISSRIEIPLPASPVIFNKFLIKGPTPATLGLGPGVRVLVRVTKGEKYAYCCATVKEEL